MSASRARPRRVTLLLQGTVICRSDNPFFIVCDGVVRGNAHEGREGHELTNHKLGVVVQVLALELGVAVQLEPAVAHAWGTNCGSSMSS